MDLYFRLNVFPIEVPALRERIADIPLLCSSIIGQLNKKLGKQINKINKKSLSTLSQYHWPGNVRELQNILEREMILATSSTLSLQSFHLDNQINSANIKSLAEAEKEHILSALSETDWRIGGDNGAAKLLGLPASTLRSKMHKLGITRQ